MGVGGRYNLNTLKQELAECQNYLRALKELVGNYEKIDQEKIDKLAGILPDQKDIAPLLIQLQALAEEYGFLIADISFNEIPEPAGEAVNQIKKIDISLNLISNGSDGYSAIKELLSGLEYNLRLFDVNAVHFISIDPPAYLINISTYYSVGLK